MWEFYLPSIFIGHVFPIWLKFKGGKGVATYVGILFCINYLLGIIFICVWVIIFIILKTQAQNGGIAIPLLTADL